MKTEAPNRDGKRRPIYLVTTLLDPEAYPAEEIAELYRQRWAIEVQFSDLKTSLGMEELRARTPEIAVKTLRVAQITYNLLRILMKEAGGSDHTPVDEISFKRTIDLVTEFRSRFRSLQNHPRFLARQRRELERRVSFVLITIRPNRREPRAKKRRPKSYQYLTSPRAEFCELRHRGKNRKVV